MRLDRWDKEIAGGLIALVIIGMLGIPAFIYAKKYYHEKYSNITLPTIDDNLVAEVVPIISAPEVAEEVQKTPPKHSDPAKSTSSTKSNSDGTATTTISEGGVSTAEVEKIAELTPGSVNPASIRFSDETGQNAGLEKVLKDYLNHNLKWSGEVAYLFQISVRNAGDTGWEGQYAGSYTKDKSGKISSAFGYIVLNTYYHQSDPYFNDYMKLVLSHEYGHHYSLYHKWVDMNLPSGVRFPDAYYNVRPLSKTTTAMDYSLGWGNCEAEIIAEDYSYIYSGYGYHAMMSTFGYPSSGTKSWFDGIASTATTTTTPETPPVTTQDNPPTINITSPSSSGELSGAVNFQADTSDDKGVMKVDFYVDNSLVGTDVTLPFGLIVITGQYANGQHSFKAIAYDIVQSTATSILVTINNNTSDLEKPSVLITNPATNPYDWSDGKDLVLTIRATDNIKVTKIKFYINDQNVGESNSTTVRVTWPVSSVGPGSYIFKAEAYDAAGNMGETSLSVNKN